MSKRDVQAWFKERDRDAVARLAAALQAAEVSRRAAFAQVVTSCQTERERLRERAKSMRQEARDAVNRAIEAEREAARTSCATAKARVKESGATAREQARAALAEEKKLQREIARLEARASSKGRTRRTSAEARSESDGAVEQEIPAELVPLWRKVKRQIKGSPRESRAEAFMRYVEEHPNEHPSVETTEREFRRLQEEYAGAVRQARRGHGTRRIAAGEVPF